MGTNPLPLDFGNIPLGSLYEDRLVEDLLLLFDVVTACRNDDTSRLVELGISPPIARTGRVAGLLRKRGSAAGPGGV